MSQALTFQATVFDVVDRSGQPWIRGTQIEAALGFTKSGAIKTLYARHADEFTPAMTAVVALPTEGGPQETRIFSLRGCHLLAMFARTPVAKAFRVWVLDVLDKLNAERPTPEPSPLSKRTDPERKVLTAIINTWVGMAPVHYANARAQVNAHFGVTSVDKLTVAQVKEAIAWVQAKIDALPPAPEQLSLPSHSVLLDERVNKVRGLVAEMNVKRRDFLLALQEVEFAVRFRPVKMDAMVSHGNQFLPNTSEI